MKIIKLLTLCLTAFLSISSFAQNFNADMTALSKFVQRMYTASPFEGVKLIEDYDNQYLLSVIVLDPAKYGNNNSTMTRVASVKAMSEASRFFNGSQITMDLVITTKDDGQSSITTEMLEEINEKSIGYVKALSLMTSFANEEGKHVFVYYKQMEPLSTASKKKK